jgi:catechol 2,3-dioxygenase-like lactoylglutathione lyase family enzyme
MPLIKIQDIAYVRYRAPDLAKMREFLMDFGMLDAGSSTERLWMRGHGPAPFLHATERGSPAFMAMGFMADSIDDLHTLASAVGTRVERLGGPAGGSVVRLKDPDSLTIEVVAGQELRKVQSARPRQGWNVFNKMARVGEAKRVVAGPSCVHRLGHVAVLVTDLKRSFDWYSDRLGLIGSDLVKTASGELVAAFLRCDLGEKAADHHTINLVSIPGKIAQIHHAAFEVTDVDDLMSGHDFLKAKSYLHTWGIGRHNVGSQIFDYWYDPWGNKVEHWTDGDLFTASDPTRTVDVATMIGNQWGPAVPKDFV